MRIGAHVSTRAGWGSAVMTAHVLELQAIQVFPIGGTEWSVPLYNDVQTNELKQALLSTALYIHAPYTFNLCEVKGQERQKIRGGVRRLLEFSVRMGAMGVVFHPGSAKDNSEEDARKSLVETLEYLAPWSVGTRVLLETDSGSKKKPGKIGSPEFIASVLDDLGVEGGDYGMVVDTEHLYARGTNLFDPKELSRFLESFGRYINLVHINAPDPGVALGSYLDRHSVSIATMEGWEEMATSLLRYDMIVERSDYFVMEDDVKILRDLRKRVLKEKSD